MTRDAGLTAAGFPTWVNDATLEAVVAGWPTKSRNIIDKVTAAAIAHFTTEERERITETYRPARGKHIRQMTSEGRRWTFNMSVGREVERALRDLKALGKIKLHKGAGAGWSK